MIRGQRTLVWRLAAALAALVVLVATRAASGQIAVQRVDVHLTIEDISPHRIIQDRLQATVESVAERLLLGRSLDQLIPLQPRLGETIGAVVERVVVGYAVTGSAAEVGPVAIVLLRLRPVGAVMREAVVAADLKSIHAKVQPLVQNLLHGGVMDEIRRLVVGLPFASLEWAAPLLEAQARASVEEVLTGYTAAIRVRPGGPAQVELTITPRDTRAIRNIGVRFRSGSIPTILLEQHAPQVASMADPLRGLPVVFTEAHRLPLERLLNEELARYGPARQYHIVATAALDVAETTYVTVIADSLLYRGKVEAHLNVGMRAPGSAIVGHLGRLVIPGTEAFVEMRLIPNTLSLEWELGGLVEVSPLTTIGLNYALINQTVTLWTALRLGRDVGMRGAWNLTQLAFEGVLTYRINEFLAGEFVGTSRGEVWLRLVSNL